MNPAISILILLASWVKTIKNPNLEQVLFDLESLSYVISGGRGTARRAPTAWHQSIDYEWWSSKLLNITGGYHARCFTWRRDRQSI